MSADDQARDPAATVEMPDPMVALVEQASYEGLVHDPAGGRLLLSLSEAAKAVGVHRDTIKRNRAAGRYPGARQDGSRAWLVPVVELLSVHGRLYAPSPPDAPPAGPVRNAGSITESRPGPAPAEPVATEVDALRSELAASRARADAADEWRRRAEVAEALAADRDHTIRALETALRALPAGSVAPVVADPPPELERQADVDNPLAGMTGDLDAILAALTGDQLSTFIEYWDRRYRGPGDGYSRWWASKLFSAGRREQERRHGQS